MTEYTGGLRSGSGPLKALARSTAKPRLAHIVIAAVLAGLVIAEAVIIGPALFLWQREESERIERSSLDLFKANVEPTSFANVDQTVRIGERVMRFSSVRGGAVYNALGEEVASFGERPTLTFATARRENLQRFASTDGRRIDVLYRVESTGLANPVILRLDTSGVQAAVQARIIDKAGSVLISAMASAVAVVVILAFGIVRPIRRLRDAATMATDNPDKAEQYRLRWSRRDELGDAARAFDLLLTAVSVTHQEDLAAGKEASDRSHFGVLTYDHGGRLVAANAASLRFLDVRTIDELLRSNPAFVRIKAANGAIRDCSPIDLMTGGDVLQTVSVRTPATETKRCMLSGVTIRKRNGQVLRHIVTLIDLTKQVAYTEALEGEVARWQKDAANGRRQLAETRALFESCLVLLEAGRPRDPLPEGAEIPIALTDRIVNSWYGEAQRAGLVEGRLEHGPLPCVGGVVSDIEAVFRQAMMLIYTRASADRPSLRIEGQLVGEDMARFVIMETTAEARPDAPARRGSAGIGRSLAQAGLSQSIRQVGGTLEETPAGANAVSFLLPVPKTAGDIRAEAA